MLDALGNVGDFVGGIGVVVTLAYLALQIRQNTSTVRAAASAAHSSSLASFNTLLAQDDAVRELFIRGIVDYDSLDSKEKTKFAMTLALQINFVAQAQLLRLDNALSEEAWDQAGKILQLIVAYPGFTGYWRDHGATHSDGFRSVVQDAMSGSAPHPPPNKAMKTDVE